jgi:hypothetical protein
MVRSGSAKNVEPGHGANRLAIGRSFLLAAKQQSIIAEEGTIANPIASTIINGAIAYTDALTAKFAGKVNQQDHSAATKVLRGVLGDRFPKSQETRLTRLLSNKDQVQYSGRFVNLSDATFMLEQLEEYARWVESEYSR